MKKEIIQKPWGRFETFVKNQPVTVKVLQIEAGEMVSLQYHKKRSEFWRILSGNPVVVIGDKEYQARSGDEFEIQKGEKHRIKGEDTSAEVLEISEGEFDEEDIVRIEDNYGRL